MSDQMKKENAGLKASINLEAKKNDDIKKQYKDLQKDYQTLEKKYNKEVKQAQKHITEQVNAKIAEEVEAALDRQAKGYQEQIANLKKSKKK